MPGLDPYLKCTAGLALRTLQSTEQSAGGVGAHLAALVDLWKDQQRRGLNGFPHPRDGQATFLIGALTKTLEKRKRDNYEDKGKGRFPFYWLARS